MFFSPSKRGWIDDPANYPNAPTDLVEVDDDLYRSLLGKQIEVGPDGMPRVYVPPPGVPVPPSVTMRQARLALLAAGKLALVDGAIAALASPEREAAQIEWEYGSHVERSSPIVEMLGPALDLDAEAMDALFIDAAGR